MFSLFQNPVGPGRYDIQKWEEAQRVNGHQSVFKSRTGKPDTQHQSFLQWVGLFNIYLICLLQVNIIWVPTWYINQ